MCNRSVHSNNSSYVHSSLCSRGYSFSSNLQKSTDCVLVCSMFSNLLLASHRSSGCVVCFPCRSLRCNSKRKGSKTDLYDELVVFKQQFLDATGCSVCLIYFKYQQKDGGGGGGGGFCQSKCLIDEICLISVIIFALKFVVDIRIQHSVLGVFIINCFCISRRFVCLC